MKRITRLGTALLFAAAALPWSIEAAMARDLKFSLLLPEHHVFVTDVVKPFVQEVEAKTKGELKVTLFPSAVLGEGKEQLRLTETGIADIALIVPSYTRGRFPLIDAGLLPFAFDSAAQGTKVLELLRKEYIEPEFKTVKLLFPAMTSPAALLTRSKPLATLADLKGITLRGTGGAQKTLLTSLGANVVSIPASDLYVAMERGTIEGTILSLASAPGYKLEELVKYVNRINFSATPIAVVMNKATWDSLTPEQKSVVAAAAQTAAVNTGKAYDGADEEGLAKLTAKGAKVVNFPAADVARLKEVAAPEWKAWADSLPKGGVDATAFLAAFRKAVASAQ